ncbi:MAG TPA: hypothetical protein PLJ38_01395 [bacterium]|nr:hypothetical protein [bacterium]
MVNTAESSDVRIAAALAISTFPDPPPEVKLIIKKLRTNIVHSSEAVKNKEISKLPDILLIDIETRQVSEYMLKSITSDYLKFISQTELKPKSIYILQFKDLKLPEVFSFNIEIIFSVFDQKLGVYLNRAKFLKKFAFEKDQIDFIVNGLKTNQINIENYFIEKNEINSKIFPCRFHPDYPYSQKSDFYKKHGDKCSELMTLNFYLDTGLNWKVIKCSECKKILNLK